MAEPWAGQFLQALPATVLGALGTLGSEFLREWETQDMRVTLFKLLLLWLVLSLLGIQLAWGFYGNTVTGLYHRPGKWQQMKLSKLTENKGRQQQKGLQRYRWVCWLLCCTCYCPDPLDNCRGLGLGGLEYHDASRVASTAFSLASNSFKYWAGEVCL
ncbi:T-cell leukemia translocation-altered gene protein isoform X1 [Grammomys surdaster]|uniref:T-cell leukemia translocation-altered gene protein isoform X1 n=1 Tax=Grammomys surdaster TaxID=491861 RepID=UPI00109EF8EE|nr:T-cell leukemia translocation-altered gene protein isoform X1 [Grammomys surdaster]